MILRYLKYYIFVGFKTITWSRGKSDRYVTYSDDFSAYRTGNGGYQGTCRTLLGATLFEILEIKVGPYEGAAVSRIRATIGIVVAIVDHRIGSIHGDHFAQFIRKNQIPLFDSGL